MADTKPVHDEEQRRVLQEYIFGLEDIREQAEELTLAHEQLKQSQDLLVAVLSNTTHGMCLIKNRTFVWCNKVLTDMLGWEQDELIGQTTERLYPSTKEYERMRNVIYGDLKESKMSICEYDFVHKNGHRIACMLTGRPIDAKDLSKGHVFSLTDFTKLKDAQDALRKAYEDLEARTEELVLTNSRLNEEIKERVKTEEKLNRYRNHLEELVKERTIELKRANEQLQQEVSERRQKEETLRTLEELESSILRAIPHAVMGMKERTIIFANDAAEMVFGWNPAELIGRSSRILYRSDEEYEEIGSHFYPALETQQFYSLEFPCRRKDGNDFICKVSAARIGKGLREKNIVVIYEDVTERKHLESHLLQSQKMEAVGTLAGGIAHDFNNLLMSIQGYTSLMLYNLEPTHDHHEKLRSIEKQVRRGAELTKQLLGFARGGKYEVKSVNLNEVIMSTSTMFGRTKREISIYNKYCEDIYPVEADEGQIEQVLLNLYVNAWQAMPAGGELYLETSNITLDENRVKPYFVKPGEYVRVSITDTGVGMDEKTKERIFEPFFTTKEMGRGTGLGLASVYGIIKNHGGFVTVYSEKGRGTTFNIYLPASQKAVVKEEPHPESITRGTETVLLIDDETAVLEVNKEILETLGYRVLTAESGREAIEKYSIHKEGVALVLLDMIMPDMRGGDTFRQLKLINPGVKVILCSGYSLNGEAVKIMDEGCKSFIQKPFSLQEISQKMREVLDK
jgi:two-component system cell cycle sensor histidine kinase/response regulator CckA